MKVKSKNENREQIGKQSGILGLLGNMILAAAKAVIGSLSNSVAVTADALNNLTDCASSLVTLAGFSFASRDKDKVHPYGHGRMEYVCGFLISILILFTGTSVGIDAFKRLLKPQKVSVTVLTLLLLCLGILAKLCMAWYVGRLNKKISSSALKAVQKDDISDAMVTAVTLAGVIAAPFVSLPVDGVLGIFVSMVILYSGIRSFAENLTLLLGEGADPVTENNILDIVYDYLPSNSVEEIALHDYGPENRLVFIRIQYPSEAEADSYAEALPLIRETIRQKLQIDATLYWELPISSAAGSPSIPAASAVPRQYHAGS